ncbi:PEP-CTERM sorting domain-containing protein [Cerasicoccus maritimus]|uniref:PEP-CTERM sorting domain-containing protein n=1 Tax=Cerasicoccus maritimus TaxID=490089 RepID=UPI002852A3F1|nr:PEP-CTERM sorting domain-containing protein [Cerasicoccus maritimus]
MKHANRSPLTPSKPKELAVIAAILSSFATITAQATVTPTGFTTPDSSDAFWSSGGDAGTQVQVGNNSGDGSLLIEGGSTLTSARGFIANSSGITASVTISGSGSAWNFATGEFLNIGQGGNGTLLISNGGGLSTEGTSNVGNSTGSIGRVTITGASSYWNAGSIFLGNSGDGAVVVSDGANITSGGISLGRSSGGTGSLVVTGSGSSVTTDTISNIGFAGSGSLTVANGGSYSTTANKNIIVNRNGTAESGMVNIHVTNNGMVNATGQFQNNDTVNLFASPTLTAGTYTPITASSFTGTGGVYNTWGGEWNGSNEFVANTVSASTGTVSGDLSSQRLSYDSANFIAAFRSDVGTGDFSATSLNISDIGGETVLNAYTISSTLTESADYIYLSLLVGASVDEYSIYFREDDQESWSIAAAENVVYDGEYLSFTISQAGDYAATGSIIPEPSTYALILSLGVFGALIRRKRAAAR